MYRLTQSETTVHRLTDNAFIPFDGGNRDYQEYVEWLAEGNEPEPYTPPPPTEADFAAAIQGHIDATAQAKGYTDGFALAGYVASTVEQWAAEATAFVAWRDSVWLYAYQEMAKVAAGERPTPTISELIGELPAIAWPN